MPPTSHIVSGCEDVSDILCVWADGFPAYEALCHAQVLPAAVYCQIHSLIYQRSCRSLSRALNIIVLVFLVLQLKQSYLDHNGTGKGSLSQKTYSTIMVHNGCQTLLNSVLTKKVKLCQRYCLPQIAFFFTK